MLDVHEVWHWTRFAQYDAISKTGGIFTDYINAFLRLKQQADGWPRDSMTDDEKNHYIQDYYQTEGILLVKEEIAKNPGLRTVAKFMLNTLWGKVSPSSFVYPI